MNDFAAEETQRAADARHGQDAGHLWRVSLPGFPAVTLPAIDKGSAIVKYNQVNGISRTMEKHHVELMEERPHLQTESPAPDVQVPD